MVIDIKYSKGNYSGIISDELNNTSTDINFYFDNINISQWKKVYFYRMGMEVFQPDQNCEARNIEQLCHGS